MELSKILKPEAVKTLTSCTSKKRLFHDLGDIADSAYGFVPGDVIDALIQHGCDVGRSTQSRDVTVC